MKKIISIFGSALLALAALCLLSGCGGESGSASGNAGGYPVVVNEIMSLNKIYAPAGDGGYYDWVELKNNSDSAVDMTGCYISDNESQALKYKIEGLTVEPHGYALIYLSGLDKVDEAGCLHANFRLSSRGEDVILSDPDGYLLSRMTIPQTEENISYGRNEAAGTDEFVWFSEPTPRAANSPRCSSSIGGLTYTNNGVTINEYCANNTFTIYDEDGDYGDWIELYNAGAGDADMSGYTLTDDPQRPSKWIFPNGASIPAGGYLVVFADGKDRAVAGNIYHTSFSLGREDTTLQLYSNQGKLANEIDVHTAAQNVSCGRAQDGSLKLFSCPTPGRANSTSSYELTANVTANLNNGILISEVLAVSTGTKTYNRDYIELYNSTSQAVSLSGYSIAKDPGEPLFTFPESASISSGGYLLVYCDGTEDFSKPSELQAGFKLNAGGDSLYLIDSEKHVVDYFESGKQRYGITTGRNGGDTGKRLFFAEPTPGKANSSKTYSGYAQAPMVSEYGGVFDDDVSVTITVPDGCTLRYTLNGSEPSNSSQKAQQDVTLSIKKTTVLRADCVRNGYLSSDIVTQTYLIGVSHTLPIVSLSSSYDGLFSYGSGIMVDGPGWTEPRPHSGANYWNGIERVSSLEFFDESGTKAVEFNAAIRCFGQYARGEPQKGLRLMLREEYGCNEVTYPFFKGDVTTFSSLLLRPSGQDWNRAKLRDELVPNIIRGRMQLDYQEARACVLYIDGEYWGIYYIREKLNEDYILSHHPDEGYQKGKIDLVKSQMFAQAGTITAYNALQAYARNHDLTKQECYDYMCSQIDLDSFINYWIVETYFANSDSGNIRCYRDHNDGKWHWMVYDLDWAITGKAWKTNNYIQKHCLDPAGHGATNNMSNVLIRKMLKNKDFRDKFISMYCYHINTTFSTERTMPILEKMAGLIEGEIPNQYQRWKAPSKSLWDTNVDIIKTFLKEKPGIAKKQLKSAFGLSDEQLQNYLDKNK